MTHEANHQLADIMIGGNHLASALIHNIGADFNERFPPNAAPEEVLSALTAEGKAGTGNIVYDCWVAWSAIMRLAHVVYRTD
jgi:hypothetical protein